MSTTIGMPIGMGVIVFTIIITGIYVRRANSEFDDLTEEIKRLSPNEALYPTPRPAPACWSPALAPMAAGADPGQAEKQATNWTAIIMFGPFVGGTMFLHRQMGCRQNQIGCRLLHRRWRHHRLPERSGHCSDYMSAASFLGISAAVMANGTTA